MEPLIASAREAIALGGQEPNEYGQMNGHSIIHWSHYLLLSTGIIGVVTAVAAAILTQWPLVFATGLLAVTSFIGSYYIKELSLGRALDDIINDLVKTIHKLYLQTIDLELQITRLGKSKDALQKTADEYETNVKKAQDRLNDQTKKFEDLVGQLKASEAKFSDLKTLYDPLKATVDQFIDSSSQLLNTVGDLQKKENGLSSSVVNLNQIEQNFDHDATQIAVNVSSLTAENKLALDYVNRLTKIVGFFHKVYPQLLKENEMQQKELEELRQLRIHQTETVESLKKSLLDYETHVKPIIQEFLTKLPIEMIQKLNKQLANIK